MWFVSLWEWFVGGMRKGLEIQGGEMPEPCNLFLMVTLTYIWKVRKLKKMWTVEVWLVRFQKEVSLQGIGYATFHRRTSYSLSVFSKFEKGGLKQ